MDDKCLLNQNRGSTYDLASHQRAKKVEVLAHENKKTEYCRGAIETSDSLRPFLFVPLVLTGQSMFGSVDCLTIPILNTHQTTMPFSIPT